MIYYFVAEGLGNIIQTTPAFNFLKKHNDDVVVFCHKKFFSTASIVYKNMAKVVTQTSGKASVVKSVCSDGSNNKSFVQSEVEMNLLKAGCVNPQKSDKIGFCGYENYDKKYDIILCNGYNKNCKIKNAWQVKEYLHWKNLASTLCREYKVASIGLPEEYIEGTINETGIGLSKSLGLIKNCKLFVSNDTGFYHAANVFSIKNIVIFTMTDITKNYDTDFHQYATLITKGIECQPCQFRRSKTIPKLYWLHNKPFCDWICRDIEVDYIYEKIQEIL